MIARARGGSSNGTSMTSSSKPVGARTSCDRREPVDPIRTPVHDEHVLER
jgi:hypothetical protein